MSPLRWDVLGLALVLALPVLAMGMRGDLTLDDVLARLPWCFGAAWAAVALLRVAFRPWPDRPGAGGHEDKHALVDPESNRAP